MDAMPVSYSPLDDLALHLVHIERGGELIRAPRVLLIDEVAVDGVAPWERGQHSQNALIFHLAWDMELIPDCTDDNI